MKHGIERRQRDTMLETEQSAAAPPAVRSFASRGSGVHAISLEDAVSVYESVRRDGTESTAATVWIDVVCPGAAEEQLLREKLRLHPLAVEDCMHGRQRPKLERYKDYLFLVAYTARIDQGADQISLEELHLFVGNGWIVSVHDHKLRLVSEVIARWRANESAFPSTATLAHAVLDGLVDSYMPVIDHLAMHVDDLEQLVLTEPNDNRIGAMLDLRRDIAAARRALWPLDEIIRRLVRRDAALVESSLSAYYQDVLDHVRRESEELDELRETLAATLQAHFSLSANQLNVTVRVMAAWSIILMAMAWIAGIYGMNFELMPELRWRYGYVWALGLMLGTGAALILYFRRRKWI